MCVDFPLKLKIQRTMCKYSPAWCIREILHGAATFLTPRERARPGAASPAAVPPSCRVVWAQGELGKGIRVCACVRAHSQLRGDGRGWLVGFPVPISVPSLGAGSLARSLRPG